MKAKTVKIAAVVIAAALIVIAIALSIIYSFNVHAKDLVDIRRIELGKDYRVVVDKTNKYLAHPDLVLCDSGKLLTVYPEGHGKGAILAKTSDDGGLTWSERLADTPQSWTTSQETPCIYKLNLSDGTTRMILTAGRPYWGKDYAADGFDCSISYDDGETWTEFQNFYSPMDCIVAMSSLTHLKENGVFVDKWLGTFHNHNYENYATILTFDANDKPQWSQPRRLLADQAEDENKYGVCELEIIRTPDESKLILLGRTNNKISPSVISVSEDEGQTWSKFGFLPNELCGDRHKAETDPATGKLVISFRQVISGHKPDLLSTQRFVSEGWVAWIGTFDALLSYVDDDASNDIKGDALLIMHDYRGADCGYAGTAAVDGDIVMISYGRFTRFASKPFIMSVRFNVAQLLAS